MCALGIEPRPLNMPRKHCMFPGPCGGFCVYLLRQAHHVEGRIIAPCNTESTEILCSLYHDVSVHQIAVNSMDWGLGWSQSII